MPNDSLPTLIVLAGGQSRRMGRPKALLPVPPHDLPLLAHVVARLRGGIAGEPTPGEPTPGKPTFGEPTVGEPIVVVASDPALASRVDLGPGVLWLQDLWPDSGALGGLATGLQHGSGWALVVACDLPLIRADVCRFLHSSLTMDAAGEDRFDALIPVVHAREQTLCALYHSRCLPAIAAHLARGDRRMTSFLPDVRVRRIEEAELRVVDPDLRSFCNVNTPKEWQIARGLLDEEGRQ